MNRFQLERSDRGQEGTGLEGSGGNGWADIFPAFSRLQPIFLVVRSDSQKYCVCRLSP